MPTAAGYSKPLCWIVLADGPPSGCSWSIPWDPMFSFIVLSMADPHPGHFIPHPSAFVSPYPHWQRFRRPIC
jgi:hypothetical protein